MGRWQCSFTFLSFFIHSKVELYIFSTQAQEIKSIEHKAAKSFNNMFKAMGDKQVPSWTREEALG